MDDEEYKEKLTKEEYYVLREKGTEKAFSGLYHNFKGDGKYVCKACGQELFSSKNKFESGTGWPSFYKAIEEGKIETNPDTSHGMKRIEVICSNCKSHLGHVFDDGPKPTGKRYCINSLALYFEED